MLRLPFCFIFKESFEKCYIFFSVTINMYNPVCTIEILHNFFPFKVYHISNKRLSGVCMLTSRIMHDVDFNTLMFYMFNEYDFICCQHVYDKMNNVNIDVSLKSSFFWVHSKPYS